MNKVLITGANGFIGSALMKHFSRMGYDVEGWDISECIQPEVNVRKINLLDETELVRHLDRFQPDIMIHCAGCADVNESLRKPLVDFNGNVLITHSILFAMHKLSLKNCRFIFLSSAAVYGNPQVLPITEEIELKPLSPYALHKVMCEEICNYFINNYNFDIKIARIFSAYGNGLKKQIFWDMHNKVKMDKCLNMFGTGNESRDYIHLEDAVQAICLIATSESNETIFNIANGEEITIREATECFANASGLPYSKIIFSGEKKEGNPINWRADISKLKLLGYAQRVEFNFGIESYVKWAIKQEEII